MSTESSLAFQMTNIDANACFDKLAYFHEEGEGAGEWHYLFCLGDYHVSYCCKGASCLVKLEGRNIPTSAEYGAMLEHPEFKGAEPLSRWPFMEYRVLHQIAPGDAIVAQNFCGAAGRLMEQALRMFGLTSRSLDGHKMRIICRRDLPKAGQWSVCHIPLHTKGDSVVEHSPSGSIFLETIKPHPNDPNMCSREVFIEWPWPTLSSWMKPLMKSAISLDSMWMEQHAKMPLSHSMNQFYQVLNLQSCSRGFPLLPSNSDEKKADDAAWVGGYWWSPMVGQECTMMMYLSIVVSRMGWQLRVFDCLDGCKLAPYQVLVYGSEWAALHEDFEALWRLQRSAYRRVRGGASAPRVRVAAPKFVSSPRLSVDTLPTCCIVNTFINFGYGGEHVSLKSGSHMVWEGSAAECPH